MRKPSTEPTLDSATLQEWVGSSQTVVDDVDARRANLLKATIDPTGKDLRAGDELPAGWHWTYCLEAPRIDQLGRDGHAALGGFLPPVALPRRMWAGTRLCFGQPLRVGETLSKVSEVLSVTPKTGRSGDLCFVTVNHKYLVDGDLRLEEFHDIVYRGHDSGRAAVTGDQAEQSSDHSVVITPTTTLLFRYSALTFNGHRIHYDIDFCKEVEGYPALIVHAPLTATLMLDLARRHYAGRELTFAEFRQRSISPLFHDKSFTIHLRETEDGCRIWVADHRSVLSAQAELLLH